MAYDAFPSTDREKKFREYRKNNSKRGNGAPSTVDGTSQFRNLDEVLREVIATVDRGGETARVHERASEIQAGSKQTQLDNNSSGGSRNPRDSAVALGGAGAHHQGRMHDDQAGARGGPRGDGAATGKDVGCAYQTAAAEETYKGLLEVGVSGSKANAMLSPQRNGDVRAMELAVFARSRDADTSTWGHPSTWPKDKIGRLSAKDMNRYMEARKDVQGPSTPQPVAKATVQQAPAADALKALAEYGSDSDDDNRMAEGEDFNPDYDVPTPEPSAAESDKSIARTEGGEPELRSVPSGPPTSEDELDEGVKLCDECKPLLEAVLAHKGTHNRLGAFKACGKCMSAAISVCPPCAATDIHGDGTKRHNDGHGTVNYTKLRDNKTPLLQIHRLEWDDGKLVCKQCWTILNKKRKREGRPPRTPKPVADAPNEMSAGTSRGKSSSDSLEHIDHSPDEIRADCPACRAGCWELTQPNYVSGPEETEQSADLKCQVEDLKAKVAQLTKETEAMRAKREKRKRKKREKRAKREKRDERGE